MTFTLKTALLSSALGLTLLGCNDPSVKNTNNQTETVKTEVIDFMGEKVAVSQDFPKELLNQTNEEFKEYYFSLHQNKNLRTDADESALSFEELGDIIAPVVAKYPDVSLEKDISDKDLRRIYKDFKSITTVEQVREKSEIIINFYDALIKKEVVPIIVEYKKTKKDNGARTMWDPNDPFGKMYPDEQSAALSRPRYVVGYITAAGEATAASDIAGLGDKNTPTKANAMRHAIWNCFGIRNVILLGASEDTAIQYLSICTTYHELNDAGERVETVDEAMDLNNNMVGRTWMAEETGWGFGWARQMPTEARIVNTMKIRAERAPKYADQATQIEGIVSRQGGWNVLWNNSTGSNSELVYVAD